MVVVATYIMTSGITDQCQNNRSLKRVLILIYLLRFCEKAAKNPISGDSGILFVAKGLNWVQASGFPGRVQTCGNSGSKGEQQTDDYPKW